MTPATFVPQKLLKQLPEVRGRLSENAPLAKITWFGVGGPAEVLFKPKDMDDLALFLQKKPDDVPITVIGVGSNMLVRDGGVPGVVVRLGREFANIEVKDTDMVCGAGTLDGNVARAAQQANISGLEFLSGVPGTIGGALRMNAGSYGGEMIDVVVGATALDLTGTRHELTLDDLGFGYRTCAVPHDWIFVEAHLSGHMGKANEIQARLDEIKNTREQSQPLRTRTGGSTFKNPEGQKAWKLIDGAGCRGLKIGGAEVSPLHCNFLINHGTATADDLERLGEEVRRRVFETFAVDLAWELKRIGIAGQGARS